MFAKDKVSKSMIDAVSTILEKTDDEIIESTPTRQQVKQAIGIAKDKRYAGGNMTGAVSAMNKINKGLAQHPSVEKELRKQNEETVDEKVLSSGETAKKEKYVKGMKKNLADFKKKYGERAKEVMYATATKMAKEDVNEASHDPREYDFEGEMTKRDLETICMHVKRIESLIHDETNMPEWVQGKITLAKDYIQTVSDYLASDLQKEDIDEALKGDQHKLDKNKNKKLDAQDFKLLRKESEQLDELSKKTLANYLRANTKRMNDPKNPDSMERKMKRHDDYFKASKKIYGEALDYTKKSTDTLAGRKKGSPNDDVGPGSDFKPGKVKYHHESKTPIEDNVPFTPPDNTTSSPAMKRIKEITCKAKMKQETMMGKAGCTSESEK